MDEAKRRLVLAWLVKSDDDLRVARLLILEENALYVAGVDPCQQAAEKASKAWGSPATISFTRKRTTLRHCCTSAARRNPASAPMRAYPRNPRFQLPI